MDMAERNGALLRRRLRSAERLSDLATARGERLVNMPRSRSSALLVRMTCADQRLTRLAISGAVQCACLKTEIGALTPIFYTAALERCSVRSAARMAVISFSASTGLSTRSTKPAAVRRSRSICVNAVSASAGV